MASPDIRADLAATLAKAKVYQTELNSILPRMLALPVDDYAGIMKLSKEAEGLGSKLDDLFSDLWCKAADADFEASELRHAAARAARAIAPRGVIA